MFRRAKHLPNHSGKRVHGTGVSMMATLRPGVRNNPPEIALRKANKSDAFWTSKCCVE